MKQHANSIRLILCTLAAAGGLVLQTGCGGGGATFQATGDKTLGQELQDLQQSYEKGIISQKEYNSIKEKLIKKYTR